jgi:hypothetical protein
MSEETLDRIREIRRLRRNVTDADYWRRLNPECSLTDQPFPESPMPYPISRHTMERHLDQIRKEGYFQTSPIVDPTEVDKLRRCIATVVRHGHHSSYALVYDEFYHVMAKLANVLSPVLGPDFQLVPDEYSAYYIPPDNRATGTRPHRDSLRTATSVEPDGTPTLVNVWIPLTDATTLNSCMYVLPAHVDPHYPRRNGGPIAAGTRADEVDLRASDLQNIRALPAQAGSVLCWSTHLLHWGARSSEYAAHPRVSFAMYYQSRRVPPYHEVTMDIPAPLAFEYRLHLIEKVWRQIGSGPPGIS